MAKKEDLEKNEETTVEEKATIEVKLKANIKYGNKLHKAGETIQIDEKDHEEFKDANVIEGE